MKTIKVSDVIARLNQYEPNLPLVVEDPDTREQFPMVQMKAEKSRGAHGDVLRLEMTFGEEK